VQAGSYRPSFGLVPINAVVFTNYEYRVNSRIVGNPEVMSIAKWYLRSTSACAVIKEPVPGAAACRGSSSPKIRIKECDRNFCGWISCIVESLGLYPLIFFAG